MILFALLVAHRVNSNCYKEQLRIHTKVAFTCVMDYTSLTGNFETEDFTILVEAAAVADADHTLQWKERMLERNAVHITKEHSMTELSLILLMIVENRLSSYVVQDR
mgnify:CR=1 FL=1